MAAEAIAVGSLGGLDSAVCVINGSLCSREIGMSLRADILGRSWPLCEYRCSWYENGTQYCAEQQVSIHHGRNFSLCFKRCSLLPGYSPQKLISIRSRDCQTQSFNCFLLAGSFGGGFGFVILGGSRCLLGCGFVELTVDLLVADDGLDVIPGLGEGDGFDKFVHAAVFAVALPVGDAAVSSIIGGEGVLGVVAELVEHLLQVNAAEADVDFRIEQVAGLEVADAGLVRERASDAGQELHESPGIGVGDNVGVELGLLANERGD